MNLMEFQLVINRLVRVNGLRLPWMTMPGSFPGGVANPAITEATWEAYIWQDPENVDPDASDKPSWDDLVANLVHVNESRAWGRTTRAIDSEERRRITEAYGARNLEEEVLYRLRGATPEQDAERDRLHAVAEGLRRRLRDAEGLEAMETIDPTDDDEWSTT